MIQQLLCIILDWKVAFVKFSLVLYIEMTVTKKDISKISEDRQESSTINHYSDEENYEEISPESEPIEYEHLVIGVDFQANINGEFYPKVQIKNKYRQDGKKFVNINIYDNKHKLKESKEIEVNDSVHFFYDDSSFGGRRRKRKSIKKTRKTSRFYKRRKTNRKK